MKKIIWITFAMLTALWTGLAAITVQMLHWVLGVVGAMQVRQGANGLTQMPELAWMAPWLGPEGLHAMQDGLISAVQGFNAIVPAAVGLGSWVAGLIWIVWGLVTAGLMLLAIVLHKLAGRRAAPQQTSVV